jgi:linoleate 9S-lipoxygenase
VTLISSAGNGGAKLSENAYLQNWISTHEGVLPGQTTYGIEFDWDSNFGTPGAFFITNSHAHDFFLNSLALQIPNHVHFNCNSWVYPASTYNRGRVFFSNRVNMLFISSIRSGILFLLGSEFMGY